jgi:hypothetical protein
MTNQVRVVEHRQQTPWGTRIVSATLEGEILSVRYVPKTPDSEPPVQREAPFWKPFAIGTLSSWFVYVLVKLLRALLF